MKDSSKLLPGSLISHSSLINAHTILSFYLGLTEKPPPDLGYKLKSPVLFTKRRCGGNLISTVANTVWRIDDGPVMSVS